MRFGLPCGFLCWLFIAPPVAAEPVPDTGAILSLWGRFTFAHGCPIAADTVLTNAHVMDIRPFDVGVPIYPYRFQTETQSGQLRGRGISNREDLAVATPVPPLSIFYPVASVAPTPGETLYWVGYSRKNKKDALARRLFTGRVVRTIAGNIILDSGTPPGSSGSCVLNSKGEVVGLVAWGLSLSNEDTVAVAVGVWGEWLASVVDRTTIAPPEPAR